MGAEEAVHQLVRAANRVPADGHDDVPPEDEFDATQGDDTPRVLDHVVAGDYPSRRHGETAARGPQRIGALLDQSLPRFPHLPAPGVHLLGGLRRGRPSVIGGVRVLAGHADRLLGRRQGALGAYDHGHVHHGVGGYGTGKDGSDRHHDHGSHDDSSAPPLELARFLQITIRFTSACKSSSAPTKAATATGSKRRHAWSTMVACASSKGMATR